MTPIRRLLEDRLSRLSEDLNTIFAESRDYVRREHAEQLNQAVRRLRIAGDDSDELSGTAENAAAQFAEGALLFRIESGTARHDRIRIPLENAAAFAAAVESREPQTAAAIAAQVSPELVSMLDHTSASRASIFPIEAGDRVVALLYCWGTAQIAALELLAQVTGVVWTALVAEEREGPAVTPPSDLVTIAPAAPDAPTTPRHAATWESLSPDEQQIHLRAQRFARVHVAEMRLYEADTVQSGRTRGDLYAALRNPIDAARQAFRDQFFAPCPSMVDYLHLELLRTLANDDPDLFGKDYPGPLV